MKTSPHRLLPAVVLALTAGHAIAGGVAWVDTGNVTVSNNVLGALNNVPVNITSNGQTIFQVSYNASTSGGTNFLSGGLVGGYWGNVVNADACTVFGGYQSTGAIPGTFPNSAQDFGCTVMGGANNSAGDLTDVNQFTQPFATVGGGYRNEARGAYSTVIGGNTNDAAGLGATNLGGSSNSAGGDYSMAGGLYAKVRSASQSGDADGDQGCFVWSDATGSSLSPFASTGANQFLVRATGGMGVGTNAPHGQLETSGAGGFTFPQMVLNCTTNTSNSWSRVAFTNTNTSKFWHFSAKCNGATNGDDELNYYYQSAGQGRNVMQIRGDGRIAIGGPAPGTGVTLDVFGTARCTALIQTSSARYKNNVQSVGSVLERFVQLRPVSFNWDEAHGGQKDMGLIAEEVAAIFPEAVATIDGQVEGINYARVTALAIEAVKEQQANAAANANRVNKLEAENAELRARLDQIEKAIAERR